MAKERKDILWYRGAFKGKTLEQAEKIAMESVEDCERPIQVKIAFSALEESYEGFDSKEMADTVDINNEIRSEFELGKSKKFLQKQYKLTVKKLDAILKNNEQKEKVDLSPKKKKVDEKKNELADLIEAKKKKVDE